MMNPRVQMPHWNPPSSQNARWIGCSPVDAGSLRKTGDGRDLLAATESRAEDGAAVDGLAVDEHRACAALCAVAAQVGVRETELEVHRLPEALAVIDDEVVLHVVDVE